MVRAMFAVDSADPTPIYAQLDRAIRAAIAAGQLVAGERLPTVRQLAVDLRVNANTVAKVYTELERSGVLATQRGVGTFVRPAAEHPAARQSARDKEKALRLLSDRLLAEAYAIGLTIDEVIRHLESRRTNSKESK
jgi:GntR family transcriptional regulator